MFKKCKVFAVVLVLMLLFSITGCGSNDAGISGTNDEKIITFGTSAGYFGASNLDPAVDWNGWYDSFFGICETLFHLDKGYTPQPWLVKSYEYTDDLTWIFQLRDDVFFFNGEKMTAESVKKSLERTMRINVRAPEQLFFDKIIADGQTLTIKTTKSSPALLSDLCDPMLIIHYVADDVDYENHPILTGPFKPVSFETGVLLDVEKFKDYWGGEPKIDKAYFKTFSDGDAVTMALQTGEIDMAVMPPAASLSLFADESQYTISKSTSTRGQAIYFNMKSPLVQDLNVRTAIAMTIDRDGFVDISNGTSTVNYGYYPEQMSYGGTKNLNLKVDKCDIDGAKDILKDAGYMDINNDGILEKDGGKLSLTLVTYTSNVQLIQFAQALQSQLKKIGIELAIKEYKSTVDICKAGDFDICIDSKGMAPTGNPQYFINIMFVTDASVNYGKYSNPKVDEYAIQLESTFEPGERDKLAIAVQQEVLDDMYYVVFANQQFYCVHRNNVTDFSAQPSEYYLLDKNTGINR